MITFTARHVGYVDGSIVGAPPLCLTCDIVDDGGRKTLLEGEWILGAVYLTPKTILTGCRYDCIGEVCVVVGLFKSFSGPRDTVFLAANRWKKIYSVGEWMRVEREGERA